MVKRIRILFVAEDKDYQIQSAEPLNYEKLMEIANRERQKYEDPLKARLKTFVRKEVQEQKHIKYIKTEKEDEITDYLSSAQLEIVTIEFFHGKKEQTIRRSIIKIAEMLDKRERQLRNLTNQLKDEVNQLNALRFIRKSTSPDEEQTIDVFLVVCDPLVEQEKDKDNNCVNYPLFHDEIDLPSHIERLRKASLSNGDFRIRPQRVWGTKKQLYQTLLHGTEGDRQRRVFSVVQIFTRVQRRKGVLMISLEGEGQQVGMRVWQEAGNLFKRQINSNILIIIGVGVNQLNQLAKQLNFNKPLILLSTISLEDKRIITTSCDRSLIDIQNTYNDRYCQVFLQSFYSNLFRRNDVRKCYQMAMKELSEPSIKQNLWCCCLHAHDPDCNWYRIVRRIGELEAHRLLKHQNYLKAAFNIDRKKLQALLLNDEQQATCTDEKICCWEKISDKSNKAFHETLDKCIIWNEREPDEVYSHLEPEQEMPNRFFQSKTYDKPTGRKRPLTIYNVLRHLMKNDICILRAPIISQAKRYFSLAREYLQTRNPCLSFHEFETSYNRETYTFKKKAEQLILQRKAPIGASIKSRRTEWIFLMQYSHDKNDSYYKTILKDLVDLSSCYSREAKLKLVLLTDDANFLAIKILNMLTKAANKNQKIVGNLKIDDPFDIEDTNTLERYHNILARHSSDYVIQKMESIKESIQAEQQIDQEKEEKELQVLRQQNKDVYLFLGFLSQFSEDGFYLNIVSHIILKQLFGRQLIEKVLNNELPVQHINLADCTYLQLHKAYHNHFKNPQNLQRLYFQQKKLQFYFLLMKLYFYYWPKANVVNYPGVIRQFINKEGIFSIDIELQWSDYEEDIEACLRQIEPTQEQIKAVLFDITNPIHVYHLTQVQKILQQVLKKKRNRHNPTTSRSFIDEKQFKVFQYLLWNIIQKSWLMSQVLYKHYQDSIRRFEMVLLIFFVQAQILLPISQIARIQIHVLMNKFPPKLQDNEFGKLTAFLRFYRNYAFKSMALDNLEPSWGNHHKCKEIIESCFFLAGRISEIFEDSSNCPKLSAKAKEDHDRFKEYLKLKHKMFKNTNSEKWLRQCLKKIQKKVLYYFSFTTKMKNTQGYQEYNQKMTAFEKQFKLGQIKYELEGYKSKLPVEMLQEKETILIEHYLRVNLEQKEVDKAKLTDCKGKVSAEYLPIFSYLCQKVQQKALFNQTGLIIFARARNLTCNGKPYFYTRKRTLLSHYLGEVFHDKQLKICYFPLTEKMFSLFQINQNKNSKCEVLCMILTVDSCSGQQLLFGQEFGVDTVRIPIVKFIEKIRSCRIKILILCGKDSTKACRRIKQLLSSNQYSSAFDPSMTHSVAHSLTRNMGTSAIRLAPISTSTIRLPSTSSQSAIKSATSNIKQSGSSNASKLKVSGTSNSGLKTKTYFPTIIAIENTKFSLNDYQINAYKNQNQPHAADYSHIQENRPSLFTNPKVSIKDDIITLEKTDKQELKQLSIKSKLKHKMSQQTPDQEENIDKILQQSVEHQFKVEVNDDSGRNRFSAILEQAKSEGTSEPYQDENLDFHTQVQTYVANEINSIAMDLIIISISKRIADRASYRDRIFTEQMIKEIIDKSKEDIHHILKSRFQCADTVFRNIIYQTWVNNQTISKVDKGKYQDLTKRFYCADNNLRDEIYYENIGHCEELKQVFETLVEKKTNCIGIIGGLEGQKSNFLQQICWTAQIKSLFKFGTFKYDFNDGNLNSLLARTFKDRDSKNNQTGILIAFDKIDKNLEKFRKDLQKLKGKSFTVIFTANKRQIAKEIQQILGFTDHHCIDFDKRTKQEINHYVYANLLSHIKEKSEFKFTSQILGAYQTKIDEIMKAVDKFQTEDKLLKALEMVRGSNARSEDEKMQVYYNFYKQNYEELINSLQQIKEITLKVV